MVKRAETRGIRLDDDQYAIGHAQRLMQIDVIAGGGVDQHDRALVQPQGRQVLRQPLRFAREPMLQVVLLLDIGVPEGITWQPANPACRSVPQGVSSRLARPTPKSSGATPKCWRKAF
jgi:hypothetical protein